MDHLVQQGKIRYGGFSNWYTWKAATAVQMQKQKDHQPFAAAQMHYSLLNREIEHEFAPFLRGAGTGLMVWSPLSSGFLSGKYTRENPHPENGRLNDFDLMQVDREFGYTVMDKVKEIAARHDASPAQVALAWLLAKQYVSSIIVGASKMHHLEDNLQAVNLQLSTEEVQMLDEVSAAKVQYPGMFYGLLDQVLLGALG